MRAGIAGCAMPRRSGLGALTASRSSLRFAKRKAPLGTRGASYMLVPGKGPGNGEFSGRHNIVLIATATSFTLSLPSNGLGACWVRTALRGKKLGILFDRLRKRKSPGLVQSGDRGFSLRPR